MAGPIDIRKVPVSARLSFFYFERGYLEVDGYAVVLRQKELRTHIPVGAMTSLMVGLESRGCVVTWRAFPGEKSGQHIRRQSTAFGW